MKSIGFKSIHPLAVFVYFVFCFALSLTSSHPAVLAASLLCAFLYDVKLRQKKAVKSFFMFYLPLLVLITVFNALFSHYGVTVLFTLKDGNSFTLEALVYGAVFGTKAVCMLLWLDCFNEVFSADKILYLFSRFSPKIALIISMTLRFIPLFRQNAENIKKARCGLGIDSSSAKGISKLKCAMHETSILITKALESAADTADSMNARGYGLKGKTYYSEFFFGAGDAAVLVFTAFTAALSFVLKDYLYASYNPVIYIEKPSLWLLVYSVLIISLFIFPLLYDIREERLWNAIE